MKPTMETGQAQVIQKEGARMRATAAVSALLAFAVVSRAEEKLKPVDKKTELLAVMVQACAYARCGDLSALASVVCDGAPDTYKVYDARTFRYLVEEMYNKTVEEYIREGFPFGELVLTSFRDIRASEVKLASEATRVFKHEWEGEGKDVRRVEVQGRRYVMQISLPNGKRYKANFIQVEDSIYWEPFGW